MSQHAILTRFFQAALNQRLSTFTPLIQVICGPRQVGKTTAVKEFLKGYPNNSKYLTFDNPGRDPHQMIRFELTQLLKIPGHKILVLDEIQNVPAWAPLLKELYDAERAKRELSVAILGSSTLDILLQGEESLLGRFELIRAPHWSFCEMRALFGWSLDDYLKFGGYPILGELWKEKTEQELSRCLAFIRDAIVEPIITKDIFSLQSVVNTAIFRQLLQIVLSLPCHEISFAKLVGQLSHTMASATIKNYLELMEKGFLIALLYRYSAGKIRQRTSTPKIVPLAPALIHAFNDPTKIDTDSAWFGHVYEAALISVFHSMGHRLYYWSNSRQDVDLVVECPTYTCAIEIKSSKSGDYRGLSAFKKEFPKAKTVLITRELGDALLAASDPSEVFEQMF
jgi:predicted AAA+ superfamily ATPase